MIKPITSVKTTGRRVIVRAGFDVPVENGKVLDDTRIKDALPTLKYLIEQKAKIVIISHLGRPEAWEKGKSMAPVAEKLGELLKTKIIFLTDDITKKDLSEMSQDLKPGSILFLENIRFYPGEEGNDESFAKLLAKFGDLYVEEAFSVAHHKATSNYGLAKLLPAYAGLGLLREISALKKIILNPPQPLIVVLGGAKIDDKIETLNNLGKHAEHILVGGAIANTFLKALGYEIGNSKASNPATAKEILRHYKHKIVLPVDVVVADSQDDKAIAVRIDKVKKHQIILDIGPESIRKFSTYIKHAKTLIWNGPFGLIEKSKFATGSKALAHIFASRCQGRAYGIIGGGETVEVFDQAKVSHFVDHISTGGGAMLEFLAGKSLPGIKVLE